jgi:hypothetical protein
MRKCPTTAEEIMIPHCMDYSSKLYGMVNIIQGQNSDEKLKIVPLGDKE